jgi:L-ascorbate metabolism protein UlaG (beta-lactamase superfamily)
MHMDGRGRNLSAMRRALLLLLPMLGCAGSGREPAVRGLPKDDPAASLSVVWVGHATVLIRLSHRFVLTDPNLGGDIFIQQRITPPSLKPEEIPPLQLIVVSHAHTDHFDRGTFARLPTNTEVIFPPGASEYMGLIEQTNKVTTRFYEPVTRGGITVTAVPVMHSGGRFIVDALWNKGYAGYVIDGFGKRIFFAGDTGYDKNAFVDIGKRFPGIDLALIPIAPAKGHNPHHADPQEAVQIFLDTGAKYMIPIHFEAYHSTAVPIDEPRKQLTDEVEKRGLQGRVFALYTGERWIDPDEGAPWVTREK